MGYPRNSCRALAWGGIAHWICGVALGFFVTPLRFYGRALQRGGFARWRANTQKQWAHRALRWGRAKNGRARTEDGGPHRRRGGGAAAIRRARTATRTGEGNFAWAGWE